jgi:hypothetical protein
MAAEPLEPTAAVVGAGDLGELGTPQDPAAPMEVLTFTYFGEVMRVNWMLTDADLVDFLELATRLDVDDPASIVALKDAMRQAIDPGDFDRFWLLGRENRQSLEDRMKVLHALYAAVGQRPTSRSAGSSGGPSTTPVPSAPASSSPASSQGGQVPPRDDARSRALRQLEGRADLQLIVADAPVPPPQDRVRLNA